MGFTPEKADEFFRECAKELLFLDTGVAPESKANLAELLGWVTLPCRRIAVGIDYTRLLLSRVLLEWQLDKERIVAAEQARRHAGELADYSAAMDMLIKLVRTHHEAESVTVIEDLFRMLFAPTNLYYLRVENGTPLPDKPIPEELRSAMLEMHDAYAWTPDGLGFLIRIGWGEETLGLLTVDRLTFPEFRDRYLNMALALTSVCGLAIENSRNRKKLLDAEKMASLGMLVAGVAHEVNTPVGVVLAVTTTLQNHTQQLEKQFSERSMTQSDLEEYLKTAKASTGLIHQNIKRIGHLTNLFRQVAVGSISLERHVFLIRDCVDEAVRSTGVCLPEENITISIQCDPSLEVESIACDWVTIFTNLISNSLKHGFMDRKKGKIAISVTKENKKLKVEYRDDGVGMNPEVRTRLFDPFFTTNFQHGMGLGMHLVYNLITHRLGGEIVCESMPGQGVFFHIEVPQ